MSVGTGSWCPGARQSFVLTIVAASSITARRWAMLGLRALRNAVELFSPGLFMASMTASIPILLMRCSMTHSTVSAAEGVRTEGDDEEAGVESSQSSVVADCVLGAGWDKADGIVSKRGAAPAVAVAGRTTGATPS